MITDIGLLTLAIAFLLSMYGSIASLYGGLNKRPALVESARNASILVFPFLTISVLALVYALYTLDFSLAYVSNVSSQSMSPFLRITALWGGQQGSVLFWAWIMAGFVMVVLIRKWKKDQELMPYVIFTAMFTTMFFIGVVLIITNPFDRLWLVRGATDLTPALFPPANAQQYIPQDGGGLNPLLRHFGMIGHPPTTYLGFTGFVIPFAYAIAALITGKSREDGWIRTTRRWTLVAWIFLSIGLILGGRWAYDVLGWGGFWGWDPVENAMLMPWLTGTAFLHSVMMTEKRGMLKKWNMILIILTYSLSLFGTFITRSGVIGSVHAFSQSALGPAFFVFIGITFVGSLVLLIKRWDTLKSEHNLGSVLSRETAFLLQNVVFLAITMAVFWGTVFPLITELVTNTKVTVGPPYFKQVTGPMFFVLVLLMGLAPVLVWRKQDLKGLLKSIWVQLIISVFIAGIWGLASFRQPASTAGLWLVSFVTLINLSEFWKGIRYRVRAKKENPVTALFKLVGHHHRRYGAYIIHLGVVMIALGFIGEAFFQQETQGTVAVGQSLTISDFSLRFDGLEQYPGSDGRDIAEASATLYQNGQKIMKLNPRRDYFTVQQQPVTVPAVYSTLGQDVYVMLVGWDDVGTNATTFKIYINPLINWVWIGGFLLLFGVIIAGWSTAAGQVETSYVLKPGAAPGVPVVKESGL